MGSDRMFGFGISMYDKTIRKKNLGFPTKCGFALTKEAENK